jgi:hypothetical protein
MTVNISKTAHFGSGEISFASIRAAYGGSAKNIKASTYIRNVSADVDWDSSTTIDDGRVPDAVENESVVTTESNWTALSLRDTITKYEANQSGSNSNLSYSDSDTSVWNNNLSRNVKKEFNVGGSIVPVGDGTSRNTGVLKFDGDLFNLNVNVTTNGEILGLSGQTGSGAGGNALYVNNTYSKSKVKVRSYGKIWSGGGGGRNGNSGNTDSGGAYGCYNIYYNPTPQSAYCSNWYAVNPNGVRSRCRGGSYRRGQAWNSTNATGYHCGNGNSWYCRIYSYYNVARGTGGNGGTGGQGRGYFNRNQNINESPHPGGIGNAGNTTSCSATGARSRGNRGGYGQDGGDWGSSKNPGYTWEGPKPSSGKIPGQAGWALFANNTKYEYKTNNSVKGPSGTINDY